MAFRVPTPNVSVVDLTVRLEKPVSGLADVLIGMLKGRPWLTFPPGVFLVSGQI